ncbi:hypothetical protein [Parapedomonas caeni]|jgi:hypothetical protein
MRQAGSIVVPLLLVTGLPACGQNTATAQHADPTDAPAADNPAAVAHAAAAIGTGTTAQAATPPAPATPPDKAPETATVAALPLKRGYYVASDTPCGQASNATTLLLRRDGIGGARDFCAFRTIEQTGPATYRVTEACGDVQDNSPPETGVTTYTLTGDTAFTSRSMNGREHRARYCAQSSMPPDFRANDISDVTD